MRTCRLYSGAATTESLSRLAAIIYKSGSVGHLAAVLACVAGAIATQGCATSRPVERRIMYPAPSWTCETNTISIGTYNLKGLADPEGLKRTLNGLPVKIWCFQEVNLRMDPSTRTGVAVERQELLPGLLPPGVWHIYYLPMNLVDSNKCVWEGQAIASQYPVRNSEVWRLPHKGEKERAALVGEVLVGNTPILVVNTDHEVSLPLACHPVGPADRQKEVEDLVQKFSQDPRAQSNGVVLVGDFNTVGQPLKFWRKTSRAEILELQESLREAGLHPLPGLRNPYPTLHTWWGYRRALDHIFTRNVEVLSWGTTKNDRGSDHRPLWVTIRLNK